MEKKHNEFKLKEDDILRMVKLILPAANFAILKIREIFCGEAEMTLKVTTKLIIYEHSTMSINQTFKLLWLHV